MDAVDFKRFKLPDWLLVGGGVVVFLFGFFDWFDTGSASSSAFKFTLTGVFPWLLIVGSALLTFQIRTGILTVKKWPWPTIFLFAAVIAAILILVRVIIGADVGDFGASDATRDEMEAAGRATSFDRKFTLWISFLGAVAAAVGAGLSFVAAGGTANDLPLVGRIKAARSGAKQPAKVKGPSRAGRDAGRRLPPAEQDRSFETFDDIDPDAGWDAPPPPPPGTSSGR